MLQCAFGLLDDFLKQINFKVVQVFCIYFVYIFLKLFFFLLWSEKIKYERTTYTCVMFVVHWLSFVLSFSKKNG